MDRDISNAFVIQIEEMITIITNEIDKITKASNKIGNELIPKISDPKLFLSDMQVLFDKQYEFETRDLQIRLEFGEQIKMIASKEIATIEKYRNALATSRGIGTKMGGRNFISRKRRRRKNRTARK